MGTLAKIIGKAAARSLESESVNIINTIASNKHGLSLALDTTLKSSHDMKVFGLGTAASMASIPRYSRFTASMHAVYAAMEDELDQQCASRPVGIVWEKFGDDLRRAPSLQTDLEEVNAWPQSTEEVSNATAAYVAAIRAAGQSDMEDGGGRLLGHFYCRYFADLFGGQVLAAPYRWALKLGPDSPRHYDFGAFGAARRASIEAVYGGLNEAGEALEDDAAREAVVAEARTAFEHNVHVYSEDGRLFRDGSHGVFNVASGFVRSRFE